MCLYPGSSLLESSCGEVDAGHLLRGKFTAGEELFGFVNEVSSLVPHLPSCVSNHSLHR